MVASCQNKFSVGPIVNFLAGQPTNRDIRLWALTQTTTTTAQQFYAAASSGLRPLFIQRPSLSLKKRKKLLSGDNTIEVSFLPMDFL